MKFTADRNLLAEAVTNAVNGIPANPMYPVRAGMRVKTRSVGFAHFTGSDGDTTFTSSVDVHIEEHGTVTVPGKLFAEIIKSLDGEDVSFSASGGMVTITCGRAVFKFQSYKEDYPEAGKDSETPATLPAEDFSDAIRAVIPSASKKDSNMVLHGLLLDPDPKTKTLTLVATDRYRVASFELPWDGETLEPCVIPTWAAERFRRGVTTPEVHLGWGESMCTMKSGDFTLTARRIAGEYADWRRFLPKEPPDVTVNVAELVAAVKRAQLVADGDEPVQLRFTMGDLYVEAGGATRSTEVLSAGYDGEEFVVLFGIPYFLDGLNGCEEEVCRFGFTGSLQPVNLQSGRFRYTLLPRRRQ
jgi:DNA polymerase III subunit beta